jgi:hypothetical protein
VTAAAAAPTVRQNSAGPFYFNSSAHLLRITRQKSNTLGELLNGLRECPEGSIFQHSFRTLQEHHFLREGFSNDFAQWAQSACNEPVLGEELAGVDVRDFTSLAELRERFVQTVDEFLQRAPAVGKRNAREPFYFCASEIVVIPTSFMARTLREFVEGLKGVSVHSIHHHFIEARLRLKLMSNDFSQWLHENLGMAEAAHKLNRIDIYTMTLEEVRQQIISIVEPAAKLAARTL